MALSPAEMDDKLDEHFAFEARDGSIETVRRLYGEDFVVDESLWRGRASGRPFGLDGRGRPLEFRLLHVFQFDGDGAIARENVWIDLAALINQLPQG